MNLVDLLLPKYTLVDPALVILSRLALINPCDRLLPALVTLRSIPNKDHTNRSHRNKTGTWNNEQTSTRELLEYAFQLIRKYKLLKTDIDVHFQPYARLIAYIGI